MPKNNHSDAAGENPPPLLMSVRQAARELGVCRTIVYELLGDDRIASVKIGRRRLIPRHAVEAFIATLTNKGGD